MSGHLHIVATPSDDLIARINAKLVEIDDPRRLRISPTRGHPAFVDFNRRVLGRYYVTERFAEGAIGVFVRADPYALARELGVET